MATATYPLVVPCVVSPHIPHGSGDAEYRLVAKCDAGPYTAGSVVALVDPQMALDDPAEIAFFLALATQSHDRLVSALSEIASAGPLVAPTEEDYDDMESAYNNGQDVGTWTAATIARQALKGIPSASDQGRGGTSPAEIAAEAYNHLIAARDLLSSIGARQTLARVRLALRSAGGAVRHAKRERMYRVTVEYQTGSGGNATTVTVPAVSDDAAVDKANAMVRKRRGVMKITGGSVEIAA